jgi:PAS domain S-box-containing protein
MTKGSDRGPPAEIASWQWRQIVNGATDTAIITTDPRGAVTSWNKGASNILGWEEAEMLGKSLSRIFAEDDQLAQLSREIEDATSVGKGGGEEGWRLRKDGSRFWAVGELSPIRDGSDVVGVTPHVLRHSFASVANDLGFTESTIAAMLGHSRGTVTSKYIHTLDAALIMATDTISGYIEGLLDGLEFKQTSYALDRSARKATLARFLEKMSGAAGDELMPEEHFGGTTQIGAPCRCSVGSGGDAAARHGKRS